MTRLESLSRAVDRALLVVGCVFLLAMMAHIVADVAARAFFNSAVIGTLETVSYYYMVIAVFLPLAFVERSGENIRVDLFVRMMPRPLQLFLAVVAGVIGVLFFSALAWQSALDAWKSTVRQETIMSNFLFYIWPSRWALPLGFGAAALAVFAKLLRAIVRREPD